MAAFSIVANRASCLRTGGAVSFLLTWKELDPFRGHREGWAPHAWPMGGPLDAPQSMPAGSTLGPDGMNPHARVFYRDDFLD